MMKSQLEDVSKDNKKQKKLTSTFNKEKNDQDKKLKTKKEEILLIDGQYNRLVEVVQNNYILAKKINASSFSCQNSNQIENFK